MKIIITAREAIDYGCWEELCDMKYITPGAVSEGLMDEDKEIELTTEEALELRLI